MGNYKHRNKDQKNGIIWGQAIGDALGLSTEFMTRNDVLQHYPNGVRDYDDCIRDRHRSRWERGAWTDDTDMMLCAVQDEYGGLDALRTAQNFYNWHKGGGMGVGLQTSRVLNMPEYTLYPEMAAELVWKMSLGKAAGNGGVMRTSILSVWYADIPFIHLMDESEVFCKLTHFDSRCVGSCVIVGLILWALLNNEPIEKEDIIGLANKYDNRIAPYIELVYSNSDITALELDDKESWGYTLKTLSAGLWAFLYGDSFENGLRTVIEQGGDADTNGAVAGAILGAKFGSDSIPQNWKTGLRDKENLPLIE